MTLLPTVIESSGKLVSYSGVTVYRIKNSQIVEYWAYLDMQHLLSQISCVSE